MTDTTTQAEAREPRLDWTLLAIREAHAELGAALSQVIDTDDAIIVAHMRTAYKLLSLVAWPGARV